MSISAMSRDLSSAGAHEARTDARAMWRRGVVMKPGKPFEVYIAQVDAFMAIQEQASGSM